MQCLPVSHDREAFLTKEENYENESIYEKINNTSVWGTGPDRAILRRRFGHHESFRHANTHGNKYFYPQPHIHNYSVANTYAYADSTA